MSNIIFKGISKEDPKNARKRPNRAVQTLQVIQRGSPSVRGCVYLSKISQTRRKSGEVSGRPDRYRICVRHPSRTQKHLPRLHPLPFPLFICCHTQYNPPRTTSSVHRLTHGRECGKASQESGSTSWPALRLAGRPIVRDGEGQLADELAGGER